MCAQEIRRLSAMLNEIYAKHTGQTAETIGAGTLDITLLAAALAP